MRMDILNFLALADQSASLPFSRQTHALGTAFDIVSPIDPVSGYGQWKHVKSQQGWPWDIKLYDNQYVYDWITEKDWSSGPRAYKKFVQNHADSAHLIFADGLIQLPRWIETAGTMFDYDIPAALTNYTTFVDCKQVGKPSSLGNVHQRLRGPFMIDHGGDVGYQPTLIHQYYWVDGAVPTLEENYFAYHYGWVRWELQRMSLSISGLYTAVSTTVSNRLQQVPAGGIKIDFPCF